LGRRARYFPVERRPLRMRPRLQPFGTDFGNGEADRRFFQRDDDAPRYRKAKRTPVRVGAEAPRSRYRIAVGSAGDETAHRAVLAWLARTVAGEHPDLTLPDADAPLGKRYEAVSDDVQEDLFVLRRDPDGTDRAVAVYVCFPSGWCPEAILGWSFQRIHAPVPDFAETDPPARSLVRAMVERGPYVRFVWTICADDVLDHHPDEGPSTGFDADTREGWLRVERQVTVPFPETSASLFLIRTYLTPFSALAPEERATLRTALACMPESTVRYKGLASGLPWALRLLEGNGGAAG
jgi:hypothetical protein